MRCEKEPGEKPGEVYADRMKLMGKDARGILKKRTSGLEGLTLWEWLKFR